jgi:hypothetical protein
MTSASIAPVLVPSAGPLPNGHNAAAGPHGIAPDAGGAGLAACPDARLSIAVADWDLMFEAVRARLIDTVGARLGELPDVPHHSAELSASLVQAVVLDCVNALDQLHAALTRERSHRPTP